MALSQAFSQSKDAPKTSSPRSLSRQVLDVTTAYNSRQCHQRLKTHQGASSPPARDPIKRPISRLDWRRRNNRSEPHLNGWANSTADMHPNFPSYSEGNLQLPSQIYTIASQRTWVEKTFQKRECVKFIPSVRDPTRCACGRNEHWHIVNGAARVDPGISEKWHPFRHTEQRNTDAYGTIEFQGGPHPSKAQYIRLSSLDTRQENVLTLLLKHWGLDLPKLLITVHGGILNFDLQPKLKRVFRKGLLKAARTTGAWIVTNGTNTGVTKHVGDAISDRTTKTRNKVVAIGITPWGIVENKESLMGSDIVVPYHCVLSTKSNTSVLNSNHSYFVLVDNGTVGKYGGEILFRKKFEKYIAQQKIRIGNGFRGHSVPVICVVLEGGANTIRSVLEYVTDTPPVPVVVCDGSGRAADLLAFTHKYTNDDGTMAEPLRDQLILTIQRTFMYTQEQAEKLFIELMLCVKKKELITVFRMGDREDSKDIDLAILTALLKGTTANPVDQLNLALTWDRVDIARSHIFIYGQEWPEGALEVAMMDALINDRVDFVKLLLENGVSMHTFLTIPRMEDLYNSRQSPSNSLRYLVRDVKKHVPSNYRYTLPDIGLVLELLIGGGFRSAYCRKKFRQRYHAFKHTNASLAALVNSIPQLMDTKQAEDLFPYPFHDLMIWAVLMKRQKMALFMWQHGEEALAKALIAGKLYSAMAHEAEQDDLEIELTEEFHHYAEEFLSLALELLGHCYKIDDDYTQQLLTYELKNFSEQTCLGLAVLANHRQFIAHTCCQMLLNDLWIGGLRMRKNSTIKVLMGILFPPYLFALDFKSKEELQLMPQTMEEHLDELEDDSSVADISLCSISEDQDVSFNEDMTEPTSTVVPKSPTKENGHAENPDGSKTLDNWFSHMPFGKKKKSPLRMGKKAYEFYNAPITKFWIHFLGYLSFLSVFLYVILDRPKAIPNWGEIYIIAVIFTMALEKIRQIIASEPVNVRMKLNVFISKVWNIVDTMGIALFAIGFVLRFIPSTLRDAQLIYCVDIIFWNIRVLEFYSVNNYLGPFVKIIGKLLRDMCYFLTIVFIAVTCYGVVRQTVLYQNKADNVSWPLRLRNVWFYPYWNIYGELFAEEIDPCDISENNDGQGNCTIYASWLAPACMTIFMLVANILMVNLLIARFNATFIRNNANSKEIWMFQRYALILQYEMIPILPPPFIIITHIYLAFKYIKRRCKGKRDFYDNGLKLFLSHEDTEKLHDFEEECMEDLNREKELKHQNSSEERLKFIAERVENMSLRLDDINMKENHLQLTLGVLDHHMGHFEDLERNLSEAIKMIKELAMKDVECCEESLNLGLPDTSPYSRRKRQSNASNFSCSEATEDKFTEETAAHKLPEYAFGFLSNNTLEIQENEMGHFIGESAELHEGELMKSRKLGDVKFFIGLSTEVLNTSCGDTKEKGDHTDELKSEKQKGTTDVGQVNSSPIKSDRDVSLDELEFAIPIESPVLPATKTPAAALYSRRGRNSLTSQPLKLNTTLAASTFIPCSMPQSSAYFTAQNTDAIATAAVHDLTSMFTPLIGEYTSITDNIDTSCLMDCSPPCSPVPNAGIIFSVSESYYEGDSPAESKQLELMKAEEMEHQRMEPLIRHRLRQLSQDDRGSISDIARVVVAELSADKGTSQDINGSEEASMLAEEELQEQLAEAINATGEETSASDTFEGYDRQNVNMSKVKPEEFSLSEDAEQCLSPEPNTAQDKTVLQSTRC
ncbi:unnamed protein product [Lymnaea stagnalis]|uniref:Transient receptor potential cation channel subfamily M member 3 n=1 Tax=Lymnaea stagnalis TaxID=6523 RepID=A0AAV2HGA3_LYMST